MAMLGMTQLISYCLSRVDVTAGIGMVRARLRHLSLRDTSMCAHSDYRHSMRRQEGRDGRGGARERVVPFTWLTFSPVNAWIQSSPHLFQTNSIYLLDLSHFPRGSFLLHLWLESCGLEGDWLAHCQTIVLFSETDGMSLNDDHLFNKFKEWNKKMCSWKWRNSHPLNIGNFRILDYTHI